MTKLKALATEKLDQLKGAIEENYDRYTAGTFKDLAVENGWAVDVAVDIDISALTTLVGVNETPELAVSNSLVVWNSLKGLSPNLAAEERIWARLCHIECLQYARDRWISASEDRDKTLANIGKHFFGRGLTGVRDDNAVSRLWWNAHVARLVWPDDMEGALKLILKTADYRQSLVERPAISSRVPVTAGVLRKLRREEWLGKQDNFRAFMKELNKLGGGTVFEVLAETEIDEVMSRCVDRAMEESQSADAVS